MTDSTMELAPIGSLAPPSQEGAEAAGIELDQSRLAALGSWAVGLGNRAVDLGNRAADRIVEVLPDGLRTKTMILLGASAFGGAVAAEAVATTASAGAQPRAEIAAKKKPQSKIINVSSTRSYPDLPAKPIKAYERDGAKVQMSYGGFRQFWNSDYAIDIFGQEEAQKEINIQTKKCEERVVKYGVGSQTPNIRKGSKSLTVKSNLYEVDEFALDRPNLASWFVSCSDTASSTYTVQPVYRKKKGAKSKSIGKAKTFNGYGQPQFDGQVLQHKSEATELKLPRKVTSKDIAKRRIGYKTTIVTAPLEPYAGQTIIAQVSPKSYSWTNWIGQKKRSR